MGGGQEVDTRDMKDVTILAALQSRVFEVRMLHNYCPWVVDIRHSRRSPLASLTAAFMLLPFMNVPSHMTSSELTSLMHHSCAVQQLWRAILQQQQQQLPSEQQTRSASSADSL